MKFLSESLNLSIPYSNHSICTTVITTLDENGFESRHIMKLSSHKNEASIKEYAVKCPDSKVREMSETLTNALQPKHHKLPPSSTVTTEKNDEKDVQNFMSNLPNFDIQEVDDFDTIDDSVLANLIYDTDENSSNNNSNLQQAVATVPNNPVSMPVEFQVKSNPTGNQITSNVNTVTNKFPILPQMYFPNSTVTINYNFSKQ